MTVQELLILVARQAARIFAIEDIVKELQAQNDALGKQVAELTKPKRPGRGEGK